jgi:dephospho-CoA kinase
MLRVALTGGIATGKSYVLARIAARGIPTLDADVLARDAVAPGTPALRAIVGRFGVKVLDATGALDRASLAGIAFEDAAARGDLERIVHPVVRAAMARWLGELERDGQHALAVVDIPLLFETGRAHEFDVVVVTACPPDEQLRRVVRRDGVTAEDAGRRLAAQWPIAEKARRAAHVIDTSGTFEETDRQVDAMVEALVARAGSEGPV